MTDQTTVELAEGLSDELRAKAPILPSDLVGERLEGEVLGAVHVQDMDKYGGSGALRLVASFPTHEMDVAEVRERLEPGAYALVRLDDEGAEEP